ncbi:MAG: hypothetical protein LH481_03805 [Burkholderiales bacterium]|nr:hypothetical protein [Burkholderiales bacterium]
MHGQSKVINIAKEFGAGEAREQRFAIYIPSQNKNGKPVAQNKWIDKTLRLLSAIGGGATAMPPIRGAWLNRESGNLVIEESVLVYTAIDPEAFAERLTELVDLVREIGRKTGQGQMAIEFNQTFYLIDIT